MLEFVESIKQVKSNYQPYKKWHKAFQDYEAKREVLHNQIPLTQDQLELAASKGRTIVEAVDIMDDFSENKAEDVEMATEQFAGMVPLATGALGALPALLYKTLSKNTSSKIMAPLMVLPVISMFAGTMGSIVLGSSLQKSASRIARFQARETVLKDPQNFVIYTPDQIQAAMQIANTLPIESAKKEKSALNPIANFKEVLTTVKSLLKDKKAYTQWRNNSLENEKELKKLFNTDITHQQLQKAKEDQDILFRTINKIDIASQEYSENVEMATNSMVASGFAGGGVAGGLVSGTIWLLQKSKVIAQNAPYLTALKKYTVPVTTFALGLAAAIYSLKLQKEAARVGRFKAKQELLNNPQHFIYYNDDLIARVNNIESTEKPDKGFLSTVKDNIKFMVKAKKDFKEYNEYKKTEATKEERIRKALKQINVSPEQLDEGKNLQEKTFRVFDKMDEMSQRYAEDVEAGTQMLASFVAPIIGAVGAAAGIGMALLTRSTSIAPMIGPLFVTIPSAFGLEIWATKLQKEASKIGLMKAMQDLNDPRNFVKYTDQQKIQAQSFNGTHNSAFNEIPQKINRITNKPESPNTFLPTINEFKNTSPASSQIYEWLNQIK